MNLSLTARARRCAGGFHPGGAQAIKFAVLVQRLAAIGCKIPVSCEPAHEKQNPLTSTQRQISRAELFANIWCDPQNAATGPKGRRRLREFLIV